MNQIQNKKIPITIILISVLSLPLSFLIKAPYDYALIAYYSENQISIPLSEYYVIWDWLSLERATIILFLSLAIGIYCYLYKTDENIKSTLKNWSIKNNVLLRFFRTASQKTANFYKVKPDECINTPEITPTSEDYIEYNSVKKERTKALCIGVVFLLLLTAEYSFAYMSTGMLITAIVLMFIQKLVGANLCNALAPYNYGNSWIWILFGFIFPSIALIVSGSGIATNEKSEILNKKFDK
ncbi:hypothetical protein [Flavobacterium sp. N3904]|uniref:hypothetical protein n=1 Tax=Flavobacterium sp. N3904 TaxID=2986835 RepID=UPI0022257298|nr:hypothetical protein [Flavobacterium sp. N3904]